MRHLQPAMAAVVALGMSITCVGSAGAQGTAVASPFHAGQWGIEGYAAGQSGGILRFFTPRTALVLTLSGNHVSTSNCEVTPDASSNKGTVVDASLGLRRHSMLAPRVAATAAIGAVGGTVQQRQVSPGPFPPSTYRTSYVGAFAEGGAQYMVADHLAVGLAYRLTARHLSLGITGQKGADFFVGVVPIRASLYF